MGLGRRKRKLIPVNKTRVCVHTKSLLALVTAQLICLCVSPSFSLVLSGSWNSRLVHSVCIWENRETGTSTVRDKKIRIKQTTMSNCNTQHCINYNETWRCLGYRSHLHNLPIFFPKCCNFNVYCTPSTWNHYPVLWTTHWPGYYWEVKELF